MAKKTTKKRFTTTARATDGQKKQAGSIFQKLRRRYPDAHCALTHANPFQLLTSTILSAQCTDVRVNMVTPALFKRFPDAQAMADARLTELEQLIRTTGFFRNKSKALKGTSRAIVDEHDGRVPDTMDALTRLPGVARKTANVVLGNAFGKNEGVVVDTHVARLSQRMGLSSHKDPKKIEPDLMARFRRSSWTLLAHLLIFHGRQVCQARKPKCTECVIAELCPKMGVKVK